MGTASLHPQCVPALEKCQLSVANYSDLKRKAGNEKGCVKSPIIFEHWQVFKTRYELLAGQDASVAAMPLSDCHFLIYTDVKSP